MDREAIWAQFDNHIRSSNGHDTFSANSLLDLIGWINNGVESMVAGSQSSQDDVDLALANFDQVMAAMSHERLQANSEHFTELTVSAAFGRLCPIFPFCR